MTTRIALRGGMVADGIGATTRPADVLIDGQLIASISAGGPAAPDCEVISLAAGSVICPGFIDAHVHAEGPLLAAGRVDGALAQGVTTLVVGQDGQSWIGATAATARYLNQYFAPVNGPLAPAGGLSVAAYGDALAGRLTQNVAVLASQGTIRHNVAGMTAGPLGPAELAAMRREVEDALADGAVGLSSGLDYLPSRFGGAGEIAGMARPLAAAGRPYVSHLRGYGPDVGSGLDELMAVGHMAGVRVHASHLWGEPADITAAFDSADARGVSVSYDMYPYRRSSTILAMLLLPAALQALGPGHTLAALTSPRQRAELLAGEKFTAEFLRHVYLGCLPASHAGLAGQSVAAAAAAPAGAAVPAAAAASAGTAGRGARTAREASAGTASAIAPASAHSARTAGEWVLDLLVSTRLNAGAHLDRPGLTDGQLAWLASGDRQCGGSDGIYQGQHPHPRGYGAFATLAEHYLTAGSATGYQHLARHLAANAADAYGLRKRGRLAPGMAADICVIGPGGITARASYERPLEQAAGVSLVLVNGVITWRDGQPVTTRHPGQVVGT